MSGTTFEEKTLTNVNKKRCYFDKNCFFTDKKHYICVAINPNLF